MADTYIKTMKDKDGNIVAPRTVASAVYLADGVTDIETALNEAAIGSIYASNVNIDDIGSYFIDTKVEGALQEIGNTLANLSADAAAVTITYTATVPYTSWTGSSAPYSKAVTVSGILATDNPIVDIVQTGTYATDQTMNTNWGLIYRAVTSANTITFYATAIPTADIPIQAKVVR